MLPQGADRPGDRLSPSARQIHSWQGLNARGSNMTTAAERDAKLVVAHVNYLFFHSTQSFIFFLLSRLRRFHPICLTRTPEATTVDRQLPAGLAEDFYLYGEQRAESHLHSLIWNAGLGVRRVLTRLPSRWSRPLLGLLYRHLLPRLRTEVSPDHFLKWAEDILQRRRARLIHAHFGPIGWRLLALKRKLGLPLVVTFLGDETATELGSWWSWWIQSGFEPPDWPARMQELFAQGDLFLVEGAFLRQRLIDLGCPPEKVQVQRIAIPVEQMPFRRRVPEPDGKVILVFAGRFCEQKGVLYALQAVHEIWTERRDIELRLIGDETMTDGKYAAEIHTYIRDHDLHDCVRLLGFLNHAEYMREMQRGRTLVRDSAPRSTPPLASAASMTARAISRWRPSRHFATSATLRWPSISPTSIGTASWTFSSPT